MRDGRWKLILSERPSRTWLYDLTADPTERKNLASREPRRVARMSAMLEAFSAEMSPPRWPALFEVPVPADPHPEGTEGASAPPPKDYVYWPN